MCKCTEKKGFSQVLSKAVQFEQMTGKEAAIFAVGEIPSFTDKANINDVQGICCYYTTDLQEHKLVEEIEVVEVEEVKPKRRKRKQKE